MKRIKILLAAILIIGFTVLGVSNLVSANNKLRVRDIQLRTNQSNIKLLEIKQKSLDASLNQEIQQKEVNKEKVEQLEKEKLDLEQKQRDLEAQLQAKLDAKRQSQNAFGTATAYAASLPTGNKADWLLASGIPQNEWWAVDSIVSRESGWNPNAVNKSSGACGLGQQLPCGKWAGAWNDPVAALKAQYGYVVARYGGYPQAVAFWNANHWY